MDKLRVVFMGTPDFAVPCLDRLLREQCEIIAVVTQPDRPKGRGQKLAASPVKEYAIFRGLTVLQPEKIKEQGFIDQLAALRPDMIIVVAFGQILPKTLLELPPLGCINVHASLLPKYRGAAPIHWAVINGETLTGVTTMYMDAGMDTGDIILKAETAIAPDETTGELYERLKVLGADALAQTVKTARSGGISRIKQDGSQATYAPLLTRQLERIDWQKPAQELHDLVRGLNPWPGAYCLHRDKLLKVWQTRVIKAEPKSEQTGMVVAVNDDGIVVATGAGRIELREVQPESKRRMGCGEYIRGNGVHVGEMLG